MPQTRASVRRSKGKDRRYKLNDGTLGLSRRRLAPGAARRGARGVAGGGANGFVLYELNFRHHIRESREPNVRK